MSSSPQDKGTSWYSVARLLLKPIVQSLGRVGIDARALLSLRHMPRYYRDLRTFRSLGGTSEKRQAALTDYDEQAGQVRSHYFHQDLLVAGFINATAPDRHIDVGSRIDGFVAHVASFRTIEIIDVRPLEPLEHPQIRFMQADLMDDLKTPSEITDSISCLHAIEHFGLGRYGDPIDPRGHEKGFRNLVRLLKPGGKLYISFPIGERTETHFNAHRIFNPTDILRWPGAGDLTLERFDYVDDSGYLHIEMEVDSTPASLRYGCGIYTFTKGYANTLRNS